MEKTFVESIKAMELLAPAGNMEKLYTAFHFGADAVYLAGKKFGLRAYADNFTNEEIITACQFAHSINKKVYVTLNIFASNADLDELPNYLCFLLKAGVDAIIVSDLGIFSLARKTVPDLNIHISTQANTTNKQAVLFWSQLGAKRVVLARELSLKEISEIIFEVKGQIEIETFVHGAMCVSMSGRCLLSNYLSGRDANKGECVQACRWKYKISEVGSKKEIFAEEDESGTYLLNSKDLNMLQHLKKLVESGIKSIKIEGRMKTAYYVATVVNTYRRALDLVYSGKNINSALIDELEKTSHRQYTTGFFFDETERQCVETSMPEQLNDFVASVLKSDGTHIWVEMRNRFCVGDTLEVVSPDQNFLKKIKIDRMYDEKDREIFDAKNVQQVLKIPCNLLLKKFDILRK